MLSSIMAFSFPLCTFLFIMKLIALEVKIGFNYFAQQKTNKLILPIYQLVPEKEQKVRGRVLDLCGRCYCSQPGCPWGHGIHF